MVIKLVILRMFIYEIIEIKPIWGWVKIWVKKHQLANYFRVGTRVLTYRPICNIPTRTIEPSF